MNIGADYLGDGICEFSVWAPLLENVSCEIIFPEKMSIPLKKNLLGYWTGKKGSIDPSSCYYFKLKEDVLRPDPASHFQPKGIHGPSQIVDHKAFKWTDKTWGGVLLEEMVIYELHVGTFLPFQILTKII